MSPSDPSLAPGSPLRVTLRSYAADPKSESHQHIQLVLPGRGRLHMNIAGTAGYAGDDRYAIVPAGAEHAFFATAPNRLIVVDFDASDGWRQSATIRGGDWFPAMTQTARAATALLVAEARAGGLDDPLIAGALRSYVARAFAVGSDAAAAEGAGAKTIRLALEFIHASFDQQIGLADIGEAAGASASTLRRLFLAQVNLSPMRYVQQVRLRHARESLATSDDSIAVIAVRAGFCDQSHLTRVFRREVGVTPGRFRGEALAKSSKNPRIVFKTAARERATVDPRRNRPPQS